MTMWSEFQIRHAAAARADNAGMRTWGLTVLRPFRCPRATCRLKGDPPTAWDEAKV